MNITIRSEIVSKEIMETQGVEFMGTQCTLNDIIDGDFTEESSLGNSRVYTNFKQGGEAAVYNKETGKFIATDNYPDPIEALEQFINCENTKSCMLAHPINREDDGGCEYLIVTYEKLEGEIL